MEDYEENDYGCKLNIIKIAGYVLLVVVLFAIASIIIKDTLQKEESLATSALEEKTELFSKEVENKNAPAKKEEHNEILIGKDGINGIKGKDGEAGKEGAAGSAGKEGEVGKEGIAGKVGKDGETGKEGMSGSAGIAGRDGIRGLAGLDGAAGKDGIAGLNGKSAFEAAVEAGYLGTEEQLSYILSTVGSKITELGNHVTILDSSLTNSVTQLNDSLTSTNAKVDECFTSVSSGKTLVAATITDKGITTAATDTFPVINDNINKLAANHYNNGFIDGQASVMDKLQVTYVKHFHTGDAASGGECFAKEIIHTHTGTAVSGGGCYNEAHWSHVHQDIICYDYRTVCGRCKDSDSRWTTEGHNSACCNKCGIQWGGTTIQFWHCPGTQNTVNYTLNCGHGDNELVGYECTCGYTEGQIISATITY